MCLEILIWRRVIDIWVMLKSIRLDDSREVKWLFKKKKKSIEENIEKNSKIESQEKFMSWKPSEEIA